MSMLAERKVKQKWSLNPRGRAWSEDSNKFGQKMLEKMGWSKGKGLGPKGDGIVEHVKVSYKNDSKGMGYKETNNQWTEHDDKFNALLESLTGEKPPEDIKIITSLEQKSQSSKVRVHYKKFTRGKDLSKASEKDLACIFGKRSLKEPPQAVEGETSAKNEKEELKNDGFTHNGGSMVDYFKKKLPNYGKSSGYAVGSNAVLKKESDSEEETRVGFGFNAEKKRKSNGEVYGTPKKKRKDDGLGGLSNPSFDPMCNNVEVQKHVLDAIEEENEQTREVEDEEANKVRKKKKKDVNLEKSFESTEIIESGIQKKNKKQKKEDVTSEENSSFYQNDAIEVKIKQGNSEVDISTDSQKIKKKKKKKQDPVAMDNPNFNENDDDVESCLKNASFEVKRKKKKEKSSCAADNPNFDITIEENGENGSINNSFEIKRKKKRPNGADNPNFYNLNEDSISSCSNNDFEVKRKKKKHADESLAVDNPTFNSFNEDGVSSCQNNSLEVKRRKKKSGDESLAVDNPSFDGFNEGSISSCQNNNFEVKRKKKKREDESLPEDNQSFNGLNEDSISNRRSNDFEVKRKKKKCEDGSLAIDNPIFDNSSVCQNGYVDVNFEVKRKKKKKKDIAVDNPNFEDSLENSNQESQNSSNKNKTDVNGAREEMGAHKNDEEPSFDLVLNITSTPSVVKPESKKQSLVKRRKSVRFSEVNEERIIPSREEIENRNELFDINSKIIANGLKKSNTNRNLEKNMNEISRKIDGFQAEIENDINEAKVQRFIGEVGNPDGENEKLPNGTRLKFKYASFGRTPSYMKKDTSRAKTSYKHLIRGDIVLHFNNTNLHKIVGYGVKKTNK